MTETTVNHEAFSGREASRLQKDAEFVRNATTMNGQDWEVAYKDYHQQLDLIHKGFILHLHTEHGSALPKAVRELILESARTSNFMGYEDVEKSYIALVNYTKRLHALSE